MTKTLRNIGLAAVTLSLPLMLSSCFKDEPLNAECDIEQATVHVANPERMFFQVTDTLKQVLYTDTVINFNVRSHADLTALAPRFKLTEGATIVPENGSVHDFSQGPVTYTVTSQDGQWSRRYKVSFTPVVVTVTDTIRFDFEQFELEPKAKQYYVWKNMTGISTFGETFATGNAGFALSMASAKPDAYPTIPMEDGYDGYGLKLITRSTGPFGMMVKKAIASGNFYIGEFDLTQAMQEALNATLFGKPFTQRPLKVTGYYKYKAGPVFQIVQDGKIVTVDRIDEGSIYAVFYRNHDAAGNPVMLLGHDVQTNPNIVALAKVKDVKATSQWTEFEMEFNYTSDIDQQLLDNMGYSLTIVFASSVKGDLFEGAIDSELCIDKVRLICSKQE